MSENTSLEPLSLSSMWMQHRFRRLADFVQASRRLGFGGVEVSHIVTPDMIGAGDVAGMGITAVHFPAPVRPSPYGSAAETLLSATNQEQRRWAVLQGQQTIDFAVRAGARAVCLHLGEVPFPTELEWALRQRYLGGHAGTPLYERTKEAVKAQRRDQAGPALAAAQRSLEELAAYARPRGMRLGIESRVHYWQIPTFEELAVLLANSDSEIVGFWYDCGHVQVLANLGFHQHQQWLEAYGSRIMGVHFHDVVGLRDHLLPGQGEIDFAWLSRYLPQDAAKTCELDWYFEEEEIVRGARHVISAW